MSQFTTDEGVSDANAFSRKLSLRAKTEATTRTANNTDDHTVIEPPPQLPIGHSNYYSCRNCRRILSETQWYTQGCSECETGPVRRVELLEYASSHFHNFFGLIAPEKSWVARLIGKKNCPNGVFAEAISDYDLEEDKEDADIDHEASEDEPGKDPLPSTGARVADEISLTNSELWRE